MLYFIYTIIYIIALIFFLPFEYMKREKNNRLSWLRERTGKPLEPENTVNKPCLWVHAVSVGEVVSAVAFIQRINSAFPDIRLIVSTVTDTGRKVAKERLGHIARIVYIPFDIPFCIRNAISSYKPSLFLIMETELWPNIIREFKCRGVPVLIINGRISEKSFNGYKKAKFFIKDVLQIIDKFCMQNELYAKRIIQIGAPSEKIFIAGNFKFDARPPNSVPDWTKLLHGRVIVAGSTHHPEEEIILNTYIKLKEKFSSITMILAPRHPERFAEVEELVSKKGLRYIKRSDLPTQFLSKIENKVVILDVIGELASVYGVCDIAIIGGSFIKHGGQNPLEPAYWSKGIVCGPSMENFPFIEEFYRENAALFTTPENLFDCLFKLLETPDEITSMGRRAREIYDKNSGAIERTFGVVKNYLN